MPVSCFPARPGHSCHNHTSENWSANVGSVRRYAAINRSNFEPLSASDVAEYHKSSRISYTVVEAIRPILPHPIGPGRLPTPSRRRVDVAQTCIVGAGRLDGPKGQMTA